MSRNYAEVYNLYTAQVIPQIDAEIAENGNFWLETLDSFRISIPHYPRGF